MHFRVDGPADLPGPGGDRRRLSPTIRPGSSRAGAVLECSLVPWDTEIFGFPVAQISRIRARRGADPSDGPGRLRRLVRRSRRCAWSRAGSITGGCASRWPSRRPASGSSRWSTARGSTGSTRSRRPGTTSGSARRPQRMSPRSRRSRPRRSRPGGSCSTIASIPELSRRRYATWVRTSFESARQTVLKAEVDGELVGFFIVEHRPDPSVYWHLTAIAPGVAGQGRRHERLADRAAASPRRRARPPSRRRSPATTLPIINLYARLGFTFASAQMTFHWLRDAEARP